MFGTGDGVHAHAGHHAAAHHGRHGSGDAELPVVLLAAEGVAGRKADLALDADPHGLQVAVLALGGEDGDVAFVRFRGGLLLVAQLALGGSSGLALGMSSVLIVLVNIILLLVSGILLGLSSDSALLGIDDVGSSDGQEGRDGDGLELHVVLLYNMCRFCAFHEMNA